MAGADADVGPEQRTGQRVGVRGEDLRGGRDVAAGLGSAVSPTENPQLQVWRRVPGPARTPRPGIGVGSTVRTGSRVQVGASRFAASAAAVPSAVPASTSLGQLVPVRTRD
jgi:hypothetical protein